MYIYVYIELSYVIYRVYPLQIIYNVEMANEIDTYFKIIIIDDIHYHSVWSFAIANDFIFDWYILDLSLYNIQRWAPAHASLSKTFPQMVALP